MQFVRRIKSELDEELYRRDRNLDLPCNWELFS